MDVGTQISPAIENIPDCGVRQALAMFDSLERLARSYYSDGPDRIECEEDRDALVDKIRTKQEGFCRQVVETPPTTVEGLAALARSIILVSPHLVETSKDGCVDERLLGVLLQKLAGIA